MSRTPNNPIFKNPNGRVWDLLESVNESIITPEGGDILAAEESKIYIVDVSDANRLTAMAITTGPVNISIRCYFEEEDQTDWISLDRQYTTGNNPSCQAIVGGMSKVGISLINSSADTAITVKLKIFKSIF